jgi:hypothetical protein
MTTLRQQASFGAIQSWPDLGAGMRKAGEKGQKGRIFRPFCLLNSTQALLQFRSF